MPLVGLRVDRGAGMTTVRCDTSNIRWHMPGDLRARLLGPAGLRLHEWLRDGRASVVKNAPHRAVYRVRLPGLDCYVKHNRLLGVRSHARELFRPIKAKREYELALALRNGGIPAPVPLAWGVAGAGIRPSASWLITETVDSSQSLQELLESITLAFP